MKFHKTLLRLMVVALCTWQVDVYAKGNEGGISFGNSTRVIFNADEKKVSFPITNETDRPFIFQSLVLNEDLESFCSNFIITPEFMHVNPGDHKMAQIIRLGGNYPDDRESLLYLQGHFIPSEDVGNKREASMINFGYAIQIKMFFRPTKLKSGFDAIDDVADELDFSVHDNKLIVKNLSAYYITINTIHVGNKKITIPDEKSMIKPFGQSDYSLPEKFDRTVTWTLINDGGYATKPLTRNF